MNSDIPRDRENGRKALAGLVKGRGTTEIRPKEGRTEHVDCEMERVAERERLKKKGGE